LRARLVSVLLTALLVALASSGYATQLVLRKYLIHQIDVQLLANADAVAHLVLGTVEEQDEDREFLLPFRVAARVSTADGTVLRRINPTDEAQPDWPEAADLDDVDETATVSGQPRQIASVSGNTRWRMVTVEKVDRTGIKVIDVAIPLTEVDHTVDQLRLSVLVVGLGVTLGVAMLGRAAIRRAFVPLAQVEETAAAIAAGDLSRRIPEYPDTTEVGRLTSALNGMLNQIERAFRAQATSEARTRRFAADASHELRTPLASIRGFAELYLQGAVPSEEVPRTMHRIEDEARRMGGLVEDLLLLARLDDRRPGRSEPVDLAVLAGDAAHDARGLDPSRHVQLLGVGSAAGPVPSMVTGDEDRLRQVVANLVANAIRHTPPGTPIEIAVGVERAGPEPKAVLEIRDHGPGLSPGQTPRVFERFYRVDASRSRGQGGGSGLGLSIVAAIVAAHGGSVTVLRTSGGGATFRVDFPLAVPPEQS
jgi:two-component system OmpR family sensor kinase